MGPDGAFITGSDFRMDGGVTASYWFGELAPKRRIEAVFRIECLAHEERSRTRPASKACLGQRRIERRIRLCGIAPGSAPAVD